jgi:hypothetical protein
MVGIIASRVEDSASLAARKFSALLWTAVNNSPSRAVNVQLE